MSYITEHSLIPTKVVALLIIYVAITQSQMVCLICGYIVTPEADSKVEGVHISDRPVLLNVM